MGRMLLIGSGVVVGLASAALIAWVSSEPPAAPAVPQSAEVTELKARVAALENLLVHVTRENDDLILTGANLHVRSGSGSTDGVVNGKGNLVIGYNESRDAEGRGGSDDRTGSHMLVVGRALNYSSYGGIVVGRGNTTSGPFASVSGGTLGMASGPSASVTGGVGGQATSEWASVTGGHYGKAAGKAATVTGGTHNHAIGMNAVVSGGERNVASGLASVVSGGSKNKASGQHASVTGGRSGRAEGYASSVGGGRANAAEGRFATVSGGAAYEAAGNDQHAPTASGAR